MIKKTHKKRKFFLILAAAVVGFFTLLTLFGDEGLFKLRELYAMRSRIQQENLKLLNSNQKLAKDVQLLKEPVFAERLIREKLGYVKEREYILLLDENRSLESKPGFPLAPTSLPAND
jgi:cell division protein FtsB